MGELKQYLVLNPIALSGRVERGSIVELSDEQAQNYGPAYLKEIIPGEENAEEAVTEDETKEETEDETIVTGDQTGDKIDESETKVEDESKTGEVVDGETKEGEPVIGDHSGVAAEPAASDGAAQ